MKPLERNVAIEEGKKCQMQNGNHKDSQSSFFTLFEFKSYASNCPICILNTVSK